MSPAEMAKAQRLFELQMLLHNKRREFYKDEEEIKKLENEEKALLSDKELMTSLKNKWNLDAES